MRFVKYNLIIRSQALVGSISAVIFLVELIPDFSDFHKLILLYLPDFESHIDSDIMLSTFGWAHLVDWLLTEVTKRLWICRYLFMGYGN